MPPAYGCPAAARNIFTSLSQFWPAGDVRHDIDELKRAIGLEKIESTS
jgi:hypothetical protein